MDVETNNGTKTAIDINNSSTGDPMIHFQVSGIAKFTIGVDNDDSDKLKIGTTAVETGTALTIDASQNVGIGNTAPTATLDVDGSAIFNESHAAVDFRVEGDTDTDLLFVDGSADFVGISTSSPTATLSVDGSAIFNESHAAVDFRVEGDTEANLLFVDGSADMVGIGTSSPQEELSVDGQILTKTIAFSTNQDQAYLIAGTASYSGLTTNWGTYGIQHRFKTDGSGLSRISIDRSAGEIMCVNNAGRVGIGTTSPGYELEVAGAIMLEDASSPAIAAGHSGIYSSSGELNAFDASGNSTVISPHHFSLVKPSEEMAWSFYSKNDSIGQQINVDMLKAIRVLENVSGEKLVYKADLAGNEISLENKEASLKEKLEAQQQKIAELEAKINALLNALTGARL